MRKNYFKAIMGIFVMMALVAAFAIKTTVSSNACALPKKVDVKFYTGNANADGFVETVKKIRVTPKKLIKELQKKGAVAKGVKVRSFVDNDTELVLNLSQAYATDVASAGTAGEYIKVGCVVNTFLGAYEAERILIQVEGKTWETGHAVYDAALQMFPNQEEEPVQPEETEPVEVNIYCGNDNADALIANPMLVESITPENLMNELKIYSGIARNVQINGFENNNGALVLDLSQAFADDVATTGTSGEYVKIGCVVNTFLDAYKAQTILITVEGSSWETGHSVIEEPLKKFENIGPAPVQPEETEPVEVNIYCGNDNADTLIANPMLVESITPENLMNELTIYSGIARNVQINGFENNGGKLVLDLSQAFADDVASSGTAGEYVKIGCVVNTFLDAYNASEITITVNGAAWETGHNVYDYALTKFN